MGGGGGNQYYANLEKLYGTQAAQAERLMGLSEKLTYPMYERMVNESLDYGSLANKERAAAQAAADARTAFNTNLGAMDENMASMGIDITQDPRYMRERRKLTTAAMGGGAAGMTGARERADQMGFARMQDTTGLLAGVPSNASSALSSTASTGSNLANMYNQTQQQNAANVGGAVRGGIDLYGFSKNNPGFFGFADGGEVLKLKGGGYVQRLAKGGIVGAMENITPPPPPTGTPTPSNAGSVGQGLMRGREMAGSGVETLGKATGSADVTAFGQGLRLGKEAQPAIDAYTQAAQQVNAILPAAGEAATTAAAEGAVMEGIAGSMGSGAALGAAMPYLGAAMLAGSALGLFKDGGKVTPGSTSRRGGEVDGPGGPKDDRVPALLSDGEFVMPVGAVKKFGLDRLEKMRQAGLEFEKTLGIAKA